MERFFKAVLIFIYALISLSDNNVFAETWQLALISDDILESAPDKDSLDKIENYFSDKNVTINDNMLSVDNKSCEIQSKKIQSEYFMTEKKLAFYHDFFKKYKKVITPEFDSIFTVNPDSACPYPFSEFFKMDGELVFIYKNRVVWYYPTGDARLTEARPEVATENIVTSSDGIVCHIGSRELDVVFEVGAIDTCFYPDVNLTSAYEKYRLDAKNDNVLKLLKETITSGKDETVELASDFHFKYKWKSVHELEIEIFQPGGVTTLNFLQRFSGTTVKTIMSPD